MAKQVWRTSDEVHFEAVIRADDNISMFDPDAFFGPNTIDRFRPPTGRGVEAANALQALGFKIKHIGTFSISGSGSPHLWQKVFDTSVEKETIPVNRVRPTRSRVQYFSSVKSASFTVPESLTRLIDRAYLQRPPIFFESPISPRVKYHHLRVPGDVAMVLRATPVHKIGITGKGVLLAMIDTGFYKHPFYAWHGYNYHTTLSPDAKRIDQDENGHGTAQAANVFANAPDVDFVGIKMGDNATLAFKTASDLHPAVINVSWGHDLADTAELPNHLRPLEAAVIEAVRMRGITVCASAGNYSSFTGKGAIPFPAMMPDVIAVGGVYAHQDLMGDDLRMEASDYASSFDSLIYPGRHVPDVCGLVGMQPKGIYIMLPVQPNSLVDVFMSGRNNDETEPDDGWAVISGTSAASPQIAGICALLKQVQPGLSPDLIKTILRSSARDVSAGMSSTGEPSGEGHDGATGAGLVDGHVAYQLARSIKTRSLSTIPGPR